MKRFVVGVIVGVGFLKEIWPYFHRSALVLSLAADKVRLRLSSVIFSNWHVVINNHIFPHIFLEDLHQVHPKVTDLAALKHFG